MEPQRTGSERHDAPSPDPLARGQLNAFCCLTTRGRCWEARVLRFIAKWAICRPWARVQTLLGIFNIKNSCCHQAPYTCVGCAESDVIPLARSPTRTNEEQEERIFLQYRERQEDKRMGRRMRRRRNEEGGRQGRGENEGVLIGSTWNKLSRRRELGYDPCRGTCTGEAVRGFGVMRQRFLNIRLRFIAKCQNSVKYSYETVYHSNVLTKL